MWQLLHLVAMMKTNIFFLLVFAVLANGRSPIIVPVRLPPAVWTATTADLGAALREGEEVGAQTASAAMTVLGDNTSTNLYPQSHLKSMTSRLYLPHFQWCLMSAKMVHLSLMLLVANFANTKWGKEVGKWLKPCHMGTHLKVLSESFPMNTNVTGFRWFSKIFASFCFGRK